MEECKPLVLGVAAMALLVLPLAQLALPGRGGIQNTHSTDVESTN